MRIVCPSEKYLIAALRKFDAVDAKGETRAEVPVLFFEELLGVHLAIEGKFEGITPEGQIRLQDSLTELRFPLVVEEGHK